MLFLFILGILLGLILSIYGILPLHINTILPILNNFSFQPLIKSAIILTMAITFTFTNFITLIFFFIPNDNDFVSEYPISKLYRAGKGYFALYLAFYGAFYSIIFSIIFVLPLILFMKYYYKIKFVVIFVLILTIIYLYKNLKTHLGVYIFLGAIMIGILEFFAPFNKNLGLYSTITGFFALSYLIVLIKHKFKKIKQTINIEQIPGIYIFNVIINSNFLSLFASLFPGIGTGIATYFGAKTMQLEDEEYIMLNAAIALQILFFSIITAIFYNKSRTAVGLYLKNIFPIKSIFFIWIMFILIMFLLALILYYIIPVFIQLYNKINIKSLIIFSVLIILSIELYFGSWFDHIMMIFSTILGLFNIKIKEPRIIFLVSITFPVLIMYLFFI